MSCLLEIHIFTGPKITLMFYRKLKMPKYSKTKKRTIKLPQYLFCFYVLFPVISGFVILRVIPILSTFTYAFFKFNLISRVKTFVGLSHFVQLAEDSSFKLAFWNTTIFAVLVISATLVISLMLAVLMDREIKLASLYELLYFIPVVVPMVPVAIVWKWIYDPTYGLLNYFLSFFGQSPKGWLLDSKSALYAIVVMSVWKMIGYYTIIFLVGLKGISRQYYEAGVIDGASSLQLFKYITLPLLKPIILFVLIMQTISAFNVFTQIYVMTMESGGAVGAVVRVIVFNIYETAFRFFRMGEACSKSMVLFLVVLILTIIAFKIGREKEA